MFNQSATAGYLIRPVERSILQRRTKAPTILVFLGIVLIYALAFTLWQTEAVPWHIHATAILLFATCLFPIAHWYTRGQGGLPIFEMIALSYALQFSMPIYTQYNAILIRNQFFSPSWDAIFEALLIVEMGVITLMLGYYIVASSSFSQSIARLDLTFLPQQRTNYLKFAILGGGFVLVLNTVEFWFLRNSSIGAVTLLLSNQFNLAIILMSYQVYSGQNLALRPALFATVATAFVLGLSSGLLENALIPIAILGVARWHATRRVPWRLVFATVLLFLILNPAKATYRQQVWISSTNQGFDQRIGLWLNLASESVSALVRPNFNDERTETIRNTLNRFDLIHKFAYVRTLTPVYIPYFGGDTYVYFAVAWIPRAIWPNKPSASDANQRIDVDYALKDPRQTSTNIGIGLLPESYANFGIIGVGFMMAIQGAIFALLNGILNGPRSEGGRAIYLSVMIYFLNGIGSSTAILFGALGQQVLANALILRFFCGRFQAGPSASVIDKSQASIGLPGNQPFRTGGKNRLPIHRSIQPMEPL